VSRTRKTKPTPTGLILAMIMLQKPKLPKAADLVEFLTGSWEDTPAVSEPSVIDDMLVLQVGDETASVALAPHAIPWEELEGPCAAAWWWPEAPDTLQNHAAHLLVSINGGSTDVVSRNLILTKLVAATAATTDALGIYWGTGCLVHRPDMFIEESQQMSRTMLPLNLWVDFRPTTNSDGSVSIFTTGMDALGQPEIEVSRSKTDPTKIMNAVIHAAHHVVDNGVPTGESLPVSETESVGIKSAPSMWDNKVSVLLLDV
jgi:hypothetical protein